jgi:DNA-directed RNA polymerase specialized sigma24 family protein
VSTEANDVPVKTWLTRSTYKRLARMAENYHLEPGVLLAEIARQATLEKEQPTEKRHRLTIHERELIMRLDDGTLSVAEIAERAGLKYHAVYGHLRRTR